MAASIHIEEDVKRNFVKLRREFIWRIIEKDANPSLKKPILVFIYTEKGEYLGSKHVAWCPCSDCLCCDLNYVQISRKNLFCEPDISFKIEKNFIASTR